MVIANIRLQFMELNRRHDNDLRSIGELFYSASSELTAITFAEALRTLLLIIDDIAVTLDAAGCICKGKLAKAKEVISNEISECFSSMTDYIKMYIQLPQTTIIKNHILKSKCSVKPHCYLHFELNSKCKS